MNAGPEVCSSETNVVLPGTRSESTTVCASLGPAFATVIVYAKVLPADNGAGRATSSPIRPPGWRRKIVTVWLLFARLGSGVAAVTSAVLVIVFQLACSATLTTTVKLAEALSVQRADRPGDRAVPPDAGLVRPNAGPDVCSVGDGGGVGRYESLERHGLGVAGAGVRDRDRCM